MRTGPPYPGKKSCPTLASFPFLPPGGDAGLGWRRILGSVHLMPQARAFPTLAARKSDVDGLLDS